MYFFILLGFLALSSFFAAKRFPNFTSRLTSKLPRFNFSRWFKNPQIKQALKDREYFSKNVSKILNGPLFIVLGIENYKLYNQLVSKDIYGTVKKFETSEDAFDVIEYQDAKYVFFHPQLLNTTKETPYNSRTRILIERIVKHRKQNLIDGIIILPMKEALKNTDAPPSSVLINEINFSTDVFEQFSRYLKITIPLYFIVHQEKVNEENAIKNPFRFSQKEPEKNIFLGFSCDFLTKPSNTKRYDYLQQSFINYTSAFEKKTTSILHDNSSSTAGMDGVYIAYHAQQQNFLLVKKYLSYFLNYFDLHPGIDLGKVSFLNTLLFTTPDGSHTGESVQNLFHYLSHYGKDKIVFSEKLLDHKKNINLLLTGWTIALACGGVFLQWKLNDFLYEKRVLYIKNSISEYQKFSELFNTELSQKFPFASTQVEKNASYESIVRVFNEFEKMRKGKQAYFFNHVSALTKRQDVEIFLENMKEVSHFLNLDSLVKPSNTSEKSGDSFSLIVDFEFRSRPAEEYLANRIVDWTFATGNSTYGSQYGSQKQIHFLWSYGNSLTFRIEFFDRSHKSYDSSLIPQKPIKNYQIKGHEHMYVQGDAVIFAYPNEPWSLLRFMNEHNVCTEPKNACSNALLQFIIPLANQSNLVFFCTIELQDVNGNLLVMPVFPIVAPSF